jgi:hypothetical protein
LLRPIDDGYILFEPVTVTVINTSNNQLLTSEAVIIKGKVINSEDNLPINGAIITIKGTDISTVTTTTDADGNNFTITVPAGSSTLIVSAVGYANVEINIGTSTNLTLVLKKAAIIDDPYSFWITVAVPDWLPQFKNDANGQNRFEQLVRRETPAHIVVKFCWMNPKQMYEFETAYLRWLYENALAEPDERELRENVSNLVTLMKECKFSIRDLGEPCLNGTA